MGEVVAGLLVASTVVWSGACAGCGRHKRVLARAGAGAGSSDARHRSLRLLRRALPLAIVPACGVGWLLGGALAGIPGSVAATVAAAVAPRLIARRRAARRAEALESQLADAVGAVASAMRSGQSLVQAASFAAGEVGEPLGPRLRALADRAGLGVPFERSLDRLVEELPTSDVRLVAGVLRLHRRTGGALTSVLDQVARTLRERRAAAREVRSLTAQARLSAVILGLLPIGFFLFLSATSKQDIAAAYHSTTGATAIGLGLSLQTGAYLWIRQLLRVEA